jgi:hypothetical protein
MPANALNGVPQAVFGIVRNPGDFVKCLGNVAEAGKIRGFTG